jgi:ketosteroid isomerase-like protein
MFDVPPPLQSKGLEAYRRTWDVFFSAFAHRDLTVRLTIGLRKIDGDWRIVHEHHSIPDRG